MRLFISIQLSDTMKDELEGSQLIMRSNGISGNYTRRDNLHLTLAFIGEYSDADEILEILDGIEFEPFTIRNEGIGSFGELWWSGISESPELKMLVKRIRRTLADEGIPFDNKKFRPHITLLRKPRPSSAMIPADTATPLGNAEMIVEHISLIRSDRTKVGMKYTEL